MIPRLPVGDQFEALVEGFKEAFGPLLEVTRVALEESVGGLTWALETIPLPVFLLVLAGIAWRQGGPRLAAGSAMGFALIDSMGLWSETMATLSLVLVATCVSLLLGVPLGVAAGLSDRAQWLLRPLLDFMQTMPAFVYLIPALLFLGLGDPPGVFATVIFAMPPAVRLTSLGIRQVPVEVVEAGLAFGCTPLQLLLKVQLPMAMPSVMAGVNQVIMLSLSMVVIAALIGARGLGTVVIKGIQQLEVGLGFEGGLAVVIVAIVLDRLTDTLTE